MLVHCVGFVTASPSLKFTGLPQMQVEPATGDFFVHGVWRTDTSPSQFQSNERFGAAAVFWRVVPISSATLAHFVVDAPAVVHARRPPFLHAPSAFPIWTSQGAPTS